jgi:hypothetical protein
MIREKQRSVRSGWGVLGVLLAIDAAALFGIYLSVEANYPPGVVTSIIVAVVAGLMYPGMFIVNPNEGKVLQLFGAYRGTVREEGLRWANPLYTKKRVSLRIRNFESAKLKVNDNEGNPIEIAAVVVAGRRHSRSGVRGPRLRELRSRADGVGRPQPGVQLHLRHP